MAFRPFLVTEETQSRAALAALVTPDQLAAIEELPPHHVGSAVAEEAAELVSHDQTFEPLTEDSKGVEPDGDALVALAALLRAAERTEVIEVDSGTLTDRVIGRAATALHDEGLAAVYGEGIVVGAARKIEQAADTLAGKAEWYARRAGQGALRLIIHHQGLDQLPNR